MTNHVCRRSLFVLLGALLVSCNSAQPRQAAPAPAATPREDKLVVFAAASLRDVFTTLSEELKRTHPGVEIALNFAGTQELRTQLELGAVVDVFASADQRHMSELLHAKRVTDSSNFARNEPVVVVAKEVAATLRSFADLAQAKRIVIGTPEVPIGRYTLQILDRAAQSMGADFRARVEANVVSRELNVRQVLNKVSLGEADAGIVYRSDALSAQDRVAIVDIPPQMNVIAEYPIAVVAGAAHPRLAHDWIQLVLATPGQDALRRAGFLGTTGASAAR